MIVPHLARICYGLPDLYDGLRSGCHADVHITSIWQIPQVIGNIIEMIMWVVGVAAVIIIIISGIRFITSEGDPARVATAKTALTNAVIGLVLSASAYLIVKFVSNGLG